MLDLGTLILVAGGPLDANGFADDASFLPPSFASFADLEIDLQDVVEAPVGPRITNARRASIRTR
jgi:hypothetical protein